MNAINDQESSNSRPYAQAAAIYRAHGWEGVLPVVGKDVNLPSGYTGRYGVWPTDEQISEWIQRRGSDNIALRLSRDIIGIDVDAYDGRAGLQTIARFEERYGLLPQTWRSTSRTDGSGILLYGIPRGIQLVSDLGSGSDVQIIRYGHRYLVVWPSIHPRTGQQYRWLAPPLGQLGQTAQISQVSHQIRQEHPSIPRPNQIPELPIAWVNALTKARGGIAREIIGVDGNGGVDSGQNDEYEPDMTLGNGHTSVDPLRVLLGLPIGEQETGLFAYLCSLWARNNTREEMIALGMLAIQQMQNESGREPWTIEHVIAKVNRVVSEFPRGNTAQQRLLRTLGPTQRAWVSGFTPGEGADLAGVGLTSETIETVETPPTVETPRIAETRSSLVSLPQVTQTSQVAPEVPLESQNDIRLPQEPIDTDYGNTLRFVRLHGDKIRYAVDEDRWYCWDGNTWRVDRLNTVLDLTTSVFDEIRLQALVTTDNDEQRALISWAKHSESLKAREYMVRGTQSERRIVTTVDEFNQDPFILVVKNGTIELKTGELRQSRREDKCTQQANVMFDPGARCPKWLAHIDFVTHNQPELADYIQRAIGYSLTGSTDARAFFFLTGDGHNGKNVLIETIMRIMGSYAIMGANSLLTGSGRDHPTAIADLVGARLVFIDEPQDNVKLNAERMKGLVGSKRVRARRMRKDFFEFDAHFKLWIAGNGRPRMRDSSDGIWNRLHEVTCLGKVGADVPQINGYGDILFAEEASGILNWALEGARRWFESGLERPHMVEEAVSEHRDDEDHYGQYIDECLTVTGSQEDLISTDELFSSFALWAALSGVPRYEIGTKIGFRRAITVRLCKMLRLSSKEELSVRYTTITGAKKRGLWGVQFTPQ